MASLAEIKWRRAVGCLQLRMMQSACSPVTVSSPDRIVLINSIVVGFIKSHVSGAGYLPHLLFGFWLDRSASRLRPQYLSLTFICDTAFRANLRLSAEALPPTAAADTADRTVPQSNRIPQEPRLQVHRVHAGRPDNRQSRR